MNIDTVWTTKNIIIGYLQVCFFIPLASLLGTPDILFLHLPRKDSKIVYIEARIGY